MQFAASAGGIIIIYTHINTVAMCARRLKCKWVGLLCLWCALFGNCRGRSDAAVRVVAVLRGRAFRVSRCIQCTS